MIITGKGLKSLFGTAHVFDTNNQFDCGTQFLTSELEHPTQKWDTN